MPITHSFAVSPTATAPVAYAAGVGQHKKWLSELEQGYAQMWQQAQGQAASASNRLFSQVLEQQAAQSRQMTGAMLNESAAQGAHQRQQVIQKQGYQYDQGLQRMRSGQRMQEQDNAGRIAENSQFTKQAIQTRTKMNEVLGSVDPQQLTQAGRTLHGGIQRDLTSLESSYSQGNLRPKDLMLSYANVAGRVNSLATQPSFKAKKEPTAQEQFDQQVVTHGPTGKSFVQRLGADGKTRSWQEVGSAPSEDQKGGATFRQNVGFVHTINGEEQTVPGLSLGDMADSVDTQMNNMEPKPWVKYVGPEAKPEIDHPKYEATRQAFINARIDTIRNAKSPEPIQGPGGPPQPGQRPGQQPGQPQPGQPQVPQGSGGQVPGQQERMAQGQQAMQAQQARQQVQQQAMFEQQLDDTVLKALESPDEYQAMLRQPGMEQRMGKNHGEIARTLTAPRGGLVPAKHILSADRYRHANGAGDRPLKGLKVPRISNPDEYERYGHILDELTATDPEKLRAGFLYKQYIMAIDNALDVWSTERKAERNIVVESVK